jgi:pSer/pThr/pTyr-binding forkhead associated (FHA) protein
MSTTGFLLKGPGGKSLEVVDRIVAGRNPDCDIVLVEGHPSRRHAQITVKDGAAWLEDLGSANGTFVNDQQITAPVQLRAGDRLRFDAEQWEFTVSTPAVLDSATVLRAVPPVDNRTVIAKPAKPATPAKAPGAWADPDLKDGQGTKLFDPKELQKMLQAGTPAQAATATALDAPYLIVKSGRLAGQNLKLKPSQSTNVWDIGSDPGKDIVISDDGVSGFHAKIVNDGNRWKLIDQMSANGTFVNGAKSNISYLASGDRIRFGPIDCVFHLPAGSTHVRRGNRSPWMIGAVSFLVTGAALAAVWWWLM